jgi:hypothetical protein
MSEMQTMRQALYAKDESGPCFLAEGAGAPRTPARDAGVARAKTRVVSRKRREPCPVVFACRGLRYAPSLLSITPAVPRCPTLIERLFPGIDKDHHRLQAALLPPPSRFSD